MSKYKGKTLLVLGTNNGSVDIVNYAREEGAYVIVADYLSREKSEAKKIADKSIEVSTLDIDGLEKVCKENNVSGVTCGVSETNLVSTRELSNRLGYPCYFTSDIWNLFQNKKRGSYCKKI